MLAHRRLSMSTFDVVLLPFRFDTVSELLEH